MEEITIGLSKKKILLTLLGSILFVILSLYLWEYSDLQKKIDPLYVKIIALAGILFFTYTSFYGFRKLLNKTAGLILNSEGIFNNTLVLDPQVIKWDNITEIRVLEVQKSKILLIYIDNNDEFMNKAKGMSRFWMRQNMRAYGTPISIISSTLKCDFEELHNRMNNYYKHSKEGI